MPARGARAGMVALVLVALASCGMPESEPAPGRLSLFRIAPAVADASDRVTVSGYSIAGDATVQVCHRDGTDLVVRDADGDVVTGGDAFGTKLTFHPPALTGSEIRSDGTCDVIVSQGSGVHAQLDEAFTYDFGAVPLIVHDVSPKRGDPSTRVTVTGENIAGDATVTLCARPGTDVVVRTAAGDVVTGADAFGTTLAFNPPVLDEADTWPDDTCDLVVRQDAAETAVLDEVFTYLSPASGH